MTMPSSQQYPYGEQSYQLQQSQTTNGGVKMVAGYALQERLGSGSFATVYKGVKIIDANGRTEMVAIKAISRNSDKITKKVLENLELEISILRTYRHPNIVCLTQVSKTEKHFYLVLEYCAGGDVQRLIRSRKTGRLTERMARRLMRDLTAGLKFLWGQELIHRDIKPQNLLLTGPLPLDELHDPSKFDSDEVERRQANFCTNSFHLKIADFGFARHLQTTSMADTLCGSPLYMAPEILQHKRYDSKADLWSTGTVLFEMISGRPPFNGQNHIDLLHNIQQKSVRLPKDVKVSTEGVKLLRLLLDRDPVSRASFSNFIKASDDFVALGCNGTPATETHDTQGEASTSYQHKPMAANLGPISEVEESNTLGTAAMESSAVKCSSQQDQQESYHVQNSTKPQHHNAYIPMSGHRQGSRSPAMVSPSIDPTIAPPSPPTISMGRYAPVVVRGHENGHQYSMDVRQYSHFSPLEASPPGPKYMPNATIPPPLTLGTNDSSSLSHPNRNQLQMQHEEDHQNVLRNMQHQQVHPYRRIDSSQHSDDSGFVMVERNSASLSPTSMRIDEQNPNCQQDKCYSQSSTLLWKQSSSRRGSLTPTNSPPSSSSRYFNQKNPISTRNFIPPGIPFIKKGMLSTSPGTGGALVGMMGSQPCENFYKTGLMGRGGAPGSNQNDSSVKSDVLAKMLAAAEDVGRRAVNVAHVGDTRAYLAMKIIVSNDSDSSLFSATSMEGVEEENDEVDPDGTSSAYLSGRARAVSVDRSLSKQLKSSVKDDNEDEDDEMPFAMASPSSTCNLATPAIIGQTNNSDTAKGVGSTFHPTLIQGHFREALKCYLKALSMLKGSVNASQRVTKELQGLTSASANHNSSIANLRRRCEISCTWLTGQFKGVLERADAANTEISKIEGNQNSCEGPNTTYKKEVLSVEELVYNHSLACGRDGAVKQLLGQYDAARSCYRSAGLLSETLLMEEKLGEEDRRVVEEYVHGFLERITEVDAIMLQQSKHVISSSNMGMAVGPLARRGSGVVGLVGTAAAVPSGY